MRTPASDLLDRLKLGYQVLAYDEVEKTALEVARKLGIAPSQVYKTLLAASGREFALAVVPGDAELSLRSLARAWSRPAAEMAEPSDITRITGYVRGSVSPLGTKRKLPVFLDRSAQGREIAVSAGRRGLELIIAGDDLCRAAEGTWADLRR
jgi:Cys-tRNA(Pro)/Cys-tRNA(Cys) deacylase